MSEEIFKPRVMPRDIPDGLLSLAIGLLQTAVLFVIPGFAFFFLTRDASVGFAAAVIAYFAFPLFSVSKIVVTSRGIRLSRILGSPKLIPWSAIESVELAPRSELVWHGWLWPIFPAKEMTPSLTSLGHYRIQFNGTSIYFPPNDPEAFKASVQSYVHDCA